MLRTSTLLRSFYYTKSRTLTALSNFRKSLKVKNSLEPVNKPVNTIYLPKGIFGQRMSVLPNGSLIVVSRSQQWVILNIVGGWLQIQVQLLLLKNVIMIKIKAKKWVDTRPHKQACRFKQNRVGREGFTVQRMSHQNIFVRF